MAFDGYKNEKIIENEAQNESKEKNEKVGFRNENYFFSRKEKDVDREHPTNVIQIVQKKLIIVEGVAKKDKIPYENCEKAEKEIEGRLGLDEIVKIRLENQKAINVVGIEAKIAH